MKCESLGHFCATAFAAGTKERVGCFSMENLIHHLVQMLFYKKKNQNQRNFLWIYGKVFPTSVDIHSHRFPTIKKSILRKPLLLAMKKRNDFLRNCRKVSLFFCFSLQKRKSCHTKHETFSTVENHIHISCFLCGKVATQWFSGFLILLFAHYGSLFPLLRCLPWLHTHSVHFSAYRFSLAFSRSKN